MRKLTAGIKCKKKRVLLCILIFIFFIFTIPAQSPHNLSISANTTGLEPALISENQNETKKLEQLIEIEKEIYSPGEIVTIEIISDLKPSVFLTDPMGKSEKLEVIFADNKWFSVYDKKSAIVLGNYSVLAIVNVDGKTKRITKNFEIGVIEKELPKEPEIILKKERYLAGEEIEIKIIAKTPEVNVIDPLNNSIYIPLAKTTEYEYVGTFSREKAIVLGKYSVILADIEIISRDFEIVSFDKYTWVKNIQNENIDFTYSAKKFDFENKTIEEYTIKLINHTINEIVFNTLSVSKEFNLKIDDTLEFGDFAEVYAASAKELNFTNASVKVTAKGTELYTCREWNFSEQKCDGTWVFTEYITSGKEYEATITPDDTGFGERVSKCTAEDSAPKGSFESSCEGVYPAACKVTGDRLRCDDNIYEEYKKSNNKYAGIKIQQYNTSVVNCINITKIELCYEWWRIARLWRSERLWRSAKWFRTGGISDCDISVDANGGSSWSVVSTNCPKKTSNPGVICTDVTTLESWNCSNFFGVNGTRAIAKSESKGTPGRPEYVVWDVFYFNVTYNAAEIPTINIKNIQNEDVDFNYSSKKFDFKNKTIGEYTIKLINHTIKEIVFNNLSVSEEFDLKIDDVPETGDLKNFVEVYAIDPGKLNFTNAIVKAVAKGNKLYKCREWNFTEQKCYGTWIEVMDIIPGEGYEFTLTQEDPAFAESLEILNVQSYPTVGGNWTVAFNTTGTANLTITVVNETTWSNVNENNDLKFLEIKCWNNTLNYLWINNSVFIENYSCNGTGYETSKVLTAGKHHLEFRFGEDIEYAHNFAEGTPSATLSFFIDSESHYASDGGMSSVASFDEVPIQLNDYGETTEKCELWDCTEWSASLVDCNPFCRGGWKCTEWNGITCGTYECVEWANADTKIDDKRMWYCSGYFDCQTWNSTTNTCELWNCTEWTMGPLEKVDYQCGPPGWNCASWEGDVCTAWDCTNWIDPTGGAEDKEDHYCGGGWDCTVWENGACEIWNCTEWVDPTPGGADLAKYDFYCSNWNCSVWDAANERCDFWNCTSRTQGGTLTVDYYCDRWNCTDWDQTYKACQTWDCLQYLSDKGNEIAAYCSGVFNCTAWKTFSYADWNQSTLDLGSGQQNTGDLTGSANITSTGSNTNVTVACNSGSCSVITETWDNTTDMIDGQSLNVTFTCSDNNAGNFWVIFNVTSVEDTTPDQINVSCEIINNPPTIPDNITFDGSADCNKTVTGTVVINASGSTDVQGDTITYVIEASLENTTTVGDTTDVSKAAGSGFSGPITTLSFFISSEQSLGSDRGSDGQEFDECPIQLNDYGNSPEKCELWNCTNWALEAIADTVRYCSGGWDCTGWNGDTCALYNCSTWSVTNGDNDRRATYCPDGWTCSSWNGTVCEAWDCSSITDSGADNTDRICTGVWNCTGWSGGICSDWNCTIWTQTAADKIDYYCEGLWNCTDWNGNVCGQWNCTDWSEDIDTSAQFDVSCGGGWECTEWNNNVCGQWNCTSMTTSGSVQRDYYCEQWNCTTWNETTKACQKWDCVGGFTIESDAENDRYCNGGWNCTTWKSFTYPTNETNTTYTNYTDVNGDYWNITNISVKIEVDSYNPEASVQQSTNDSDLELDMWNGTAWVTIGTFNLNETYTGDGLNTTNYNFTLSTTNSGILAAWQNSSNQDIRIRGIYMDYYNETTIDEINYTNVWITLNGNGKKWIVIGNHTNGTTLSWNTSTVPDQKCVNFRAKAIDLNGSNTYIGYYTGDCCTNIDNTPPNATLIGPANSTRYSDDNVNFTCNATDNFGLQNITLYIWDSTGLYYTNTTNISGTQNQSVWNVTDIPDENYEWNCLSYDAAGNSDWAENNWSFTVNTLSAVITPVVRCDYSFRKVNYTITISNAGAVNQTYNITISDVGSNFSTNWAVPSETQINVSNESAENITLNITANQTGVFRFKVEVTINDSADFNDTVYGFLKVCNLNATAKKNIRSYNGTCHNVTINSSAPCTDNKTINNMTVNVNGTGNATVNLGAEADMNSTLILDCNSEVVNPVEINSSAVEFYVDNLSCFQYFIYYSNNTQMNQSGTNYFGTVENANPGLVNSTSNENACDLNYYTYSFIPGPCYNATDAGAFKTSISGAYAGDLLYWSSQNSLDTWYLECNCSYWNWLIGIDPV